MAEQYDMDAQWKSYKQSINLEPIIVTPNEQPIDTMSAYEKAISGPLADITKATPEAYKEAVPKVLGGGAKGLITGTLGAPGEVVGLISGILNAVSPADFEGNPHDPNKSAYDRFTEGYAAISKLKIAGKEIPLQMEGVSQALQDIGWDTSGLGDPFQFLTEFVGGPLTAAKIGKDVIGGTKKVTKSLTTPSTGVDGVIQPKKKVPDRHTREKILFKIDIKDGMLLDETGAPRTFYHGSPKKFGKFDVNKTGYATTDNLYGWIDRQAKTAYFAGDKNVAQQYGKVREFNLRMEKPLILDNFEFTGGVSKDIKMAYIAVKSKILSVIKKHDYSPGLYKSNAWDINADDVALLKKKGYDGIIVPKEANPRREEYFIVFDSNQIIDATKGKVK